MEAELYPRLEKYEILKVLGEGGMGAVYLARHRKIDRLVAIKLLHANLARDPMIRERFKNEAALLAKLTHPNIVTLYDYEERPDGLFLIMEYVEGTTLDRLLAEHGPLSLDQAKPIFFQILDGVGYAHRHGVIHRDIKPANIIITPDWKVKILDFGIGKIVGEPRTSELTQTGVRIGTLMYMAPEQVAGRGVSIQSDIYALGLTFFQILTGAYPYQKDQYSDFEMSLKIVQEYLLDEEGHPYHSVPEPIKKALAKAIQKEPLQRYQSCEEFKTALEMAYAEWTSMTTEALEDFETFVEEAIATQQTAPEPMEKVNEKEGGELTTQIVQLLIEGKNPSEIEKKKKVRLLAGGIFFALLLGGILYAFVYTRSQQKQIGDNDPDLITQHFPPSETLEVMVPLEKKSLRNEQEQLGLAKKDIPAGKRTMGSQNASQRQKSTQNETKVNEQNQEQEKEGMKLDYGKFRLFLTVNASHKKKLLGNYETRIEVTNTADVPYTSLLFEFEYYNKKGELLEKREYQFLDEVPAKGVQVYEVKHKTPSGTDRIGLTLKQAYPLYP